MKKKSIGKVIGIISMTAVMLVGVIVAMVFFATPPEPSQMTDPYASIDKENEESIFVINNLAVNIDVDEKGTAQVEEHYTVQFMNIKRRGISRYLPTNSGERYDNISVEGDVYFVDYSEMGSFISVNTGVKASEPPTLSNVIKDYVIKYTLYPPATEVLKNGEYYMNVVGQGCSTTIANCTVNVSLPFASEEIVVYKGRWGDNAGKRYSVVDGYLYEKPTGNDVPSGSLSTELNGNTITITAEKLSRYEGISLGVQTTGKFGTHIGAKFVVTAVIAAVLIILLLIFRLMFKEPTVIPVVNVYPPKDSDGNTLSPLDMGYLIDHSADASDVTALIFAWAENGNLMISNDETDSDEVTLIKLNELPPETPDYERGVYNKLFESGNRVKLSSLQNKTYQSITAAQHGVARKYSGKLYTKRGKTIAGAVALAAVAVAFLACCLLSISVGYFNWYGVFVVFTTAILFFFGLLYSYRRHKLGKGAKAAFAIMLALATAICAICNTVFLFYFMPIWCALPVGIFAAVAGLIAPFFNYYTIYYAKTLGEIIGFKQFLITAEKDRMEAMLEENPQYYYDILPYAQILGVSSIWQDKFSELEVAPPEYYSSATGQLFDIMMLNMMFRNMRTTMISTPKSKGGGFSGFSGGGFGGGGGFSGGGFGGGGIGSR